MDTLCGIGLPELIILALLGFVVIGPERSQDLALRSGRFLRTAMRSQWWREFNQVAHALRDLPTTLVRMAEIEEAQAELRRTMREIEEEVSEVNADLTLDDTPAENTIRGGAVTDPWGIRNAAAGTRINRPAPQESPSPQPSSPDEPAAPAPTDETPNA